MIKNLQNELVLACLFFEKQKFCLPYTKSFINYKIEKEAFNTEEIKYSKITDIKNLVDTLSYRFQIKLFVQVETEIYQSEKYGPDFFFRFFNKTVIFHSFVAKIGPLPTGLSLKKGAISDLKKSLNCKDVDKTIVSFTLQDDLNKIEDL